MNPNGRQADEKQWDTKFRHSFFTNYATDPDIHTLLFISGGNTNAMIREALRDWMVKHQSTATDSDFRRQLFVAASSHAAMGQRPVSSQLLREMGQEPAAHAGAKSSQAGPSRQAKVDKPRGPHPAPPVAVQAHIATAHKTHERPPLPKPEIMLDFGSGPEEGESAFVAESEPKPSQRDKWLARHRPPPA
jgi:hypothetical protein